jgi:hypothetical protein
VIDSDISTNGDLTSSVPPGQYFDVAGNGGYPGIPAYGGSFSLSGSPELVSTKGWMANSGYSLTKIYNSTFFLNQIPSETTINTISSSYAGSIDLDQLTLGTPDPTTGYIWWEYDGSQLSNTSLQITNSKPIKSLGGKKIVLIAKNADIMINANISLNIGSDFLMIVAGKDANGNYGNITVSSAVLTLQGIYVSDNQFNTSTGATQLHVTGSVVAYGRVSLQRDLGTTQNSTTPAEIFEYSPALELLFPKVLSRYPMSWKEVAP